MTDANKTSSQLAQLATYRSSLEHLLEQAAMYGGLPFAPIITANGIAVVRANIAELKAALLAAGIAITDEPGDLATPQELAGAPAMQPATPSVSQDQIDLQEERLQIERGRLTDLLIQEAKMGSAWAPPYVTGGIREARANIKRIKKTLSDWGIKVADHPDDTR